MDESYTLVRGSELDAAIEKTLKKHGFSGFSRSLGTKVLDRVSKLFHENFGTFEKIMREALNKEKVYGKERTLYASLIGHAFSRRANLKKKSGKPRKHQVPGTREPFFYDDKSPQGQLAV
tara:strand:- start:3952 stop:4311 length:360 start_codon:yes stop_codon:yes gene_type:complete